MMQYDEIYEAVFQTIKIGGRQPLNAIELMARRTYFDCSIKPYKAF